MKNTMMALACALTAPLAFAQVSTTVTEQTATAPVTRTTETTTTAVVPVERTRETTTTTTAAVPVPVTRETTTTTTFTEGTVSTYTPGKTIMVRRAGVTEPVSYAMGKTVRFVNRAGREIKENLIRPGARVHVYYDGAGQTQVVSRVVVDDD